MRKELLVSHVGTMNADAISIVVDVDAVGTSTSSISNVANSNDNKTS
jgi:hypothetical protein